MIIRVHIFAIAIVTLSFGAITSAYAAGFEVTPGITQTFMVDDNFRLSADPDREIELAGYSLIPTLNYQATDGKTLFRADFRGEIARFDENRFDSEDARLDLTYTRTTERYRWGLDGYLNNDSTRTSETDTSGLIGFASEVNSGQIRPYFSLVINENNVLQLGVGYQGRFYETLARIDYRVYSADVNWTRTLSPRWQSQLQVYASDYEPEERVGTESKTVGVQGGLVRNFSEKMTGTLLVGARQVDTDSTRVFNQLQFDPILGIIVVPVAVTSSDSSNGFTGRAALEFDDERWSAGFELSEDIRPSGDGFLLQTIQLEVNANYRLNDRLNTGIKIRGYLNTGADDANSNFEREFIAIRPHLRWQFAERWSVDGAYLFRRQKYPNSAPQNQLAETSGVYVNLRFTGKTKFGSR